MLAGTLLGGVIAQLTNLGVPYIVRAAMLGLTLVVAWAFMRDIGFTPDRNASPVTAVRNVVNGAVVGGLRNAPVRWLMLAAPFATGVGFYAFYAFQPYLLELYGDPNAYSIAGLAAASIAGAQIVGGFAVPWVRRLFARRTQFLILATVGSVVILAAIGITNSFIVALLILILWCVIAAIEEPMRRAFINPLIPSEQRATVLSFDSLIGSTGGVVIQPALGRTADVFGYGTSYVVAAGIQALSLPFVLLARRENAPSDPIRATDADDAAAEAATPAA
jgi:MFS family permease